MNKFKKLTVFCGSKIGIEPKYAIATKELGAMLAENNITLVYGGGKVGLMGILADAVLANKGNVIGVIPKFLVEKELLHPDITQVHITDSMHERKELMAKFADGFILLPGAAGSAEEFMEIYTWAQLGLHQKPLSILNIDNYYYHFLKFLDHAVANGFMDTIYREMIIVENSPEKLLERFISYQAPSQIKWTKADKILT